MFEKIRKERYERFMRCFDHVANQIDDIYKVHWIYIYMCVFHTHMVFLFYVMIDCLTSVDCGSF